MSFNKWLDTFVEEKGLDTEQLFEAEGPSGLNIIPLGVVLDHIKITTPAEKAAIKRMVVRIDFVNGDVTDYFRYLAQVIAI
jgi:hypothetical protein